MSLPPSGDAETSDWVPRWGVVHVHTDYSDGNRSVAQVVEAAEGAKLDFVIVTDHNTLGSRTEQGYHGDVLIAAEVEITPSRFARHLLALGLPSLATDLHRRPTDQILAEIRAQRGLAWVPHPRGFCNPWLAAYNAPWQAWDQQIDGIELSTFLVDWAESVRPWNLVRRLVRGEMPSTRPSERLLALWDRLNQLRPVVGFVGLDAHYRQALGGRVRTPTYESLFRTHQVVVWTPRPSGDSEQDLARLRTSLREGHFASVLGAGLGRTPVRWTSVDGTLRLELPDDLATEVFVVRDGLREAADFGREGQIAAPGPGVFRAEVYRDGHPWIFTNPVRVTAAEACQDPAAGPHPQMGREAWLSGSAKS